MALRCYPLQPGGLLAIQSVLIGLTTAEGVYREVTLAFPVVLLLIFMVAGIYFLRDMLLYVFTWLLLKVHSSSMLAVLFCGVAALLSAFLDALTVVAVAITVGVGFYEVYHRVASGKQHDAAHDATLDAGVQVLHRDNLEQFRAFLRGLMMHAAVGTAIGGVMTQVGEPQNLLIAEQAGWNFGQFFLEVAPVSVPVAVAGLTTCWLVDRFRLFGYGAPLPDAVRAVLRDYSAHLAGKSTMRDRQVLIVQAIVALILVFGLAFHVAEVGLIGLVVIILATSFTGIVEEHRIGKAFESALAVHRAARRVLRDRRRDPRAAPVRAGHQRRAGARGPRAGGGAVPRDRRALHDQRQRVRRLDLHHRDQVRLPAGRDNARAVRRRRGGHQHGHQHPERRDARTARPRSCSC